MKQWVNILQARIVEAMVTTTVEHDMTDALTSTIVQQVANKPEASMLLSEESDVTEAASSNLVQEATIPEERI